MKITGSFDKASEHEAIIARAQEIWSKYPWGSQKKLMQDLSDDYNISLRYLLQLVPVKITGSFPKAKR